MIVNATPLIIFGKIDKLQLLKDIFTKIIISSEVYKEVVQKGIEVKAPDAYLVKEFVDNGEIKVNPLNQKGRKIYEKIKRTYKQLDEGEASTIALVLQKDASEVLMDEDIGRKIARLYGIKPRGSLRVLILGYQNGLLDEEQVEANLRLMMQANFRVSAEVIARFWELFERVK
jgi:predicted nucleic acid-binding protein